MLMRPDETSEMAAQNGTAVMDPVANQAGGRGVAAGAPADNTAAADAGSDEAKAKQDVKKAEFRPLGASAGGGEKPGMDLLLDVTLPVSVELGRTTMTIKEVLSMSPGTVVELDRAAGEPVDVLISGKVIGKGDVVVVEEKFGVRISELVNRLEGIKKA
jgi:flagellar motor switch protein FliN/FliY